MCRVGCWLFRGAKIWATVCNRVAVWGRCGGGVVGWGGVGRGVCAQYPRRSRGLMGEVEVWPHARDRRVRFESRREERRGVGGEGEWRREVVE
jgi:hypothetical protein